MIQVVFIGFGNVNFALCNALYQESQISVTQIYNRTKKNVSTDFNSIPITCELSEIAAADVYIIGIPDDSIAIVSEALPFENRLVIHTSGGAAMEILSDKNRKGVFYPLQTFSKQREVDFTKIPICVEASTPSDVALLKKLGASISEKVVEISSDERTKLHIAAVFVNNFVNHLYEIGHEMLSANNIPFDLLQPLIIETANKIQSLSPSEAQTGPARRNDQKTIEKHLHLLQGSEHLELYQQLTTAIQTKYGKKL